MINTTEFPVRSDLTTIFDYDYWMTTDIERGFNYYDKRKWLKSTFPVIPVIVNVLYVVTVFGLRKFMTSREAFSLKPLLLVWNVSLAFFSILGSFRTIGFNASFLYHRGFHSSVCVEPVINGVYGFWCWLFIMSKIPELGDTIFIVLRKQKLIFLHWFHHMSVLMLVWLANSNSFSLGGYFICMNFFVHSIMYSYYAAKSLGIRMPKSLSMSITFSQLIQMFIGTYITLYAFLEKNKGMKCDTDDMTIYVSLFLYGSYLVLFANFFIQSYLKTFPWNKIASLTSTLLDYIGVKVKINNETIVLNNNLNSIEDRMTKKCL